MMKKKEIRLAPLAAQVNDGDEARQLVDGYAAVFNQETVIYESEYSGWKYMEKIDRSAFNGADMSEAVFKYNHKDDALVLARTSNSTMTLAADDYGLKVSADIIDTTAGRDIYKLIRRGDLNKMSFAFTVKSEEVQQDKENRIYLRTITAFDKIYDVAVVDFPAYDGTSIQARSREYFAAVEEQLQQAERRRRLILLSYL